MTNSMASSHLRENVILTKVIFTTDGTNGCVKGDIRSTEGIWYPLVEKHLPVLLVQCKQIVVPIPCVADGGVDPLWVATDGVLLEMEGRGA